MLLRESFCIVKLQAEGLRRVYQFINLFSFLILIDWSATDFRRVVLNIKQVHILLFQLNALLGTFLNYLLLFLMIHELAIGIEQPVELAKLRVQICPWLQGWADVFSPARDRCTWPRCSRCCLLFVHSFNQIRFSCRLLNYKSRGFPRMSSVGDCSHLFGTW
jgi:hypothetical protein